MHQLIKVGSGISEEQAAIPKLPGPELILDTNLSNTNLQVTGPLAQLVRASS